MSNVLAGLDILQKEYWKKLKGANLGLLCNQASLDSQLGPAKNIIDKLLPGQLKALFGPQHGHGGEDQDNMVETGHSYDKDLGVPVFSLYSKDREPSIDMLESLEVLIIDLQDIGTRVYTFASTVLNCLKAASKAGKKVLILDRPNPLGGEIIEGNLLQNEFYSFVGPYTLPMRHGLTMGELALIFNDKIGIEADLSIVPMTGWSRNMIWQQTGLRWLMPSPNMPLPETAQVYPGQVIWEGTNLSEGRGTCRPFEIFGAPFLKTGLIKQRLNKEVTKGCFLQEVTFRPTFHKWRGDLCKGFMIHILNHDTYCPYFTSIALMEAIIETHMEEFLWKSPPYEYEYKKMPIDLITGSSDLRKNLEKGETSLRLKEKWLDELEDYRQWRKPYILY